MKNFIFVTMVVLFTVFNAYGLAIDNAGIVEKGKFEFGASADYTYENENNSSKDLGISLTYGIIKENIETLKNADVKKPELSLFESHVRDLKKQMSLFGVSLDKKMHEMKAMKTKILLFTILSIFSLTLFAQKDKSPSGMRMPPAKVVVAEVSRGMIAPESEFIGTVFYVEVSRVASEVNGRVDALFFEAGQRVKQETELVRLNAELLEKTLQSQQAAYEEVFTQLEKARIDFRRAEKLFQKKTIQEQAYDMN